MDLIGLIIEIILLIFGIYLYLFSIGKINAKDATAQERANKFRNENSRWLRLLSLAFTAIMLVNVALHIRDLLT